MRTDKKTASGRSAVLAGAKARRRGGKQPDERGRRVQRQRTVRGAGSVQSKRRRGSAGCL